MTRRARFASGGKGGGYYFHSGGWTSTNASTVTITGGIGSRLRRQPCLQCGARVWDHSDAYHFPSELCLSCQQAAQILARKMYSKGMAAYWVAIWLMIFAIFAMCAISYLHSLGGFNGA